MLGVITLSYSWMLVNLFALLAESVCSSRKELGPKPQPRIAPRLIIDQLPLNNQAA